MDLARYFSLRRKLTGHESTHSAHEKQGYLPLLANPINEDVLEVVSGNSSDLEKTNTHTSTLASSNDTTTLAGNGRTSRGNIIIYKQHTEASTIELFYDLFFVANLAYFTAMHQHTDAESLINYLKLFTLMWFTWLSVTLFDVRFSIDCVWNRFHKAIQFGIFTGFVYAGPVFDKYSTAGVEHSYRRFATVLVIGRVAIAVQYLVVMWQGRMFRQTLVPIGLSAAVHAAAAVGYGITIVVFPRGRVGLEEQISWVVISILEGLCIFLIAMIWRIISFKYTHLVERLQLLTLIIIGEGIIGMVKSVACITKGQTSNNMSEIGTVIAAVILLYLLWMLYFDQLSHDRFGTVRQQVWALMHYPLHSAILLCVEGNTSLIVWNSAVQVLKWIWTMKPNDYTNPADGYSDTSDYLSYLNQSMLDINGRFKSKYWNTTYNWNTNFTAIENYTKTYGFKTEDWNNKTGDVVRYMFDRVQVFVYEAHADSLAKLNAVTTPTSSSRAKLDAVSDVFNTTVMQFYIGGGCVLLVLAIMYWFNKVHKTKYEFGEIINRVVVGFTLIIVGVAAVIADQTTGGFKFRGSAWLVPIVVLCYAGVLVLDNILKAVQQYTARHPSHHHHHAQHNRDISWGASTIANMDSNNETGGLISKYASRAPSPGGTPRNLTPKGTPRTPRGHTPTPSLSLYAQTGYTPYENLLPQPRDFAASHHIRGTSFSPGFDSDVTLRDFAIPSPSPSPLPMPVHTDRQRAHTGDFSYENTPVDATGLGIGISVHRPSPSSPSLYSNNNNNADGNGREALNGLKEQTNYKSLGVMNERDYDRRGCGIQPPPRARTVSFGEHGLIG